MLSNERFTNIGVTVQYKLAIAAPMSSQSDQSMTRYIVAFASMSIGAAVAAIEMAICTPMLPAQNVPNDQRDREVHALALGASVTAFAVGYRAATLLYRRLGAKDEQFELAKLAKAHMALLHVFSAVTLVSGVFMGVRNGKFVNPTLIVGMFLLSLAMFELFQVWREQRRALNQQLS